MISTQVQTFWAPGLRAIMSATQPKPSPHQATTKPTDPTSAGGNAASIDDSATETVTGTCYSETGAHFSPVGWVEDSTRQACLFGK